MGFGSGSVALKSTTTDPMFKFSSMDKEPTGKISLGGSLLVAKKLRTGAQASPAVLDARAVK